MSKFNTKKIVEKVENRAGGQAYKQSDEMAFVSLLLTSFVKDQFYRKANESLSDMKGYIKKIKDKEFLAKSAIFARDEFGMRSITHALAGELASEISGKEWSKNFYSKVVSRVDDMSEILSYYLQNKTDIKSPKFPNSLKKGFAKAFDKFDAYQLGKYRSENKDVKLVDIVNLVHPTPTKKNGEALSQLINGDLKSTGTWESMLTSAGQKANDEEELKDLKADAWDELLSTRRIGYFGLLRNLRNIITQAPNSVTKACEMLVDENLIAKSKVLPFRFSKAYDEISKLDPNKEVRDVLKAINEALNISVMNVPKLDGETLVVIDVSGSMSGTPSEIASLFGAMLIKANECDVMTFATKAEYINYDPSDTVISLRNKFRFSGGGTNVKSVFEKANKSYDNIILLSDFQSWLGYTTPTKEYNAYKKKYNVNPHVFSWDLAGMSTLQFPENQIYCLAGFSDKVFDVMKILKTDKKALLNRINSIQI